MSWQNILDVSLLRSGKVAQAAIVGQDGEVWAESAGCNMTREEGGALVQVFGAGAGASGPAREVSIGGRRYTTTMGCLDMILARRKDAYGGTSGCVVKKTERSVIVAEYHDIGSGSSGDPQGNGTAMTALALVERLADYLISQGY